jgi:hypothetical protein
MPGLLTPFAVDQHMTSPRRSSRRVAERNANRAGTSTNHAAANTGTMDVDDRGPAPQIATFLKRPFDELDSVEIEHVFPSKSARTDKLSSSRARLSQEPLTVGLDITNIIVVHTYSRTLCANGLKWTHLLEWIVNFFGNIYS